MPDARAPVRTRREYLDWLRGVAVLLMIEAHLIDSWTSQPDRGTTIFGYAVIVGGMGSVFFLLLDPAQRPLLVPAGLNNFVSSLDRFTFAAALIGVCSIQISRGGVLQSSPRGLRLPTVQCSRDSR